MIETIKRCVGKCVFCAILLLPFLALGAQVEYEELLSVSENGFAVAWKTDEPTLSILYYSADPDDLTPWEESAELTAMHLVWVDDLEPDTTYFYSTSLDTTPASADENPFSPGWVHTQQAPPGNYLFSFVTLNDTHVGEETAGLIVIGGLVLTPGFTWDDPDRPYWLFTNEAAVATINELAPDFVIHKGDVTSTAEAEQFADAQAIFGELDADLYYARGNHDRPRDGHDYFKEVLGIDPTYYYFDHGPLRFIILDTNNELGSGDLSDEQFPWLADVLNDARDAGRRVMIFSHHTFALHGALAYAVNPADCRQFTELLANYPNFVGLFAGHSHRARLNFDDRTGWVPYVETPATKEYPQGFAFYRVYEGGYTQTFHRPPCAECLAWADLTRGEYYGLAPWLMLGDLYERNFVVRYPDYQPTDDDAADDDAISDDDNDNDNGDDTPNGQSSAADSDRDESGCGCG